ncbi:hypothetical protein [Caldovatus aquaticus]|uniref:Uncharacterized protein n=1 Tax=Caldovatus aquaticus TaxID=2865671 RepID=A0ABS7F5F3_9PROT|nr:hypothetical protein [Caldovatus aquaticus]MBW8270724.1 hypothetical protein [Caldovatus aquaticus]
MARRDWIGLAVAAGVLGLLLLYRALHVEPRAWGAACAAAAPPLACHPRAALLWLQHWQLWGGGALLLGLRAFLGGPFWVRVAAVTLGAAAIANHNATWGMLGLLLGAWAWIGGAGRQAPRALGAPPPGQ